MKRPRLKNNTTRYDRAVAIFGTILIHALLLLIVLKLTIAQPVLETPQDESFDVMLGMDEEGDGGGTNVTPQLGQDRVDNQGASAQKPASANRSQPRNQTQNAAPSTRGNMPTSNSRNTRSNTSTSNNNRSTSNANTNSNSNSSANTQKPKATLGSRNSGSGVGRGSGSGQGESGNAGIQGSPTGSLQYSLAKRKLVNSPNKFGSFSQNGKVRIQIFVDRSGKIVRHRILSSTAKELSNIALSKLSQVKFNADSKAPPEQQGTITFKFQLR